MIRNSTLVAGLVALASLAATSSVYAACTYPKAPGQFPDGTTASKDEMVAASKEVKAYMAQMDEYLKCVDSEDPPAPPGTKLTPEQTKAQNDREAKRVQQHNAAVTEEESVGAQFNTQLRAWKEKNK